MTARIYPGIHEDAEGAMNPTGQIIRDAWVFELIPETETCAGWDLGRIQSLYDQVDAAWQPYGHLPSRLPAALAERHRRIYAAATVRARAEGWDPERALADD